jgi:hypothetical protein
MTQHADGALYEVVQRDEVRQSIGHQESIASRSAIELRGERYRRAEEARGGSERTFPFTLTA